MIREYSRFTVT